MRPVLTSKGWFLLVKTIILFALMGILVDPGGSSKGWFLVRMGGGAGIQIGTIRVVLVVMGGINAKGSGFVQEAIGRF